MIRLTEKEDLRTRRGRYIVLNAVRSNPDVLLWVSIPCAGGCAWQRVNVLTGPNAEQLVSQHIRGMKLMWDNMVLVAGANRRRGGRIAIEWPSNNDYWRRDDVLEFVEKFGLYKSQCHGCSYGLRDERGTPIKKPWTIATDDVHLAMELEKGK